MNDDERKKKLVELAKKLKHVKSKSERRRLMAHVDAILEIESSPDGADDERAEAWERNYRDPTP